jgi:HD-GYP domain-containing protein (c-di-GMP phosphodiesterase class II)
VRPISSHDIQIGQGLSFAVFDRDGKLLLEAGHVVRSEGQRDSLLQRGFVRDDTAARRGAGSGAEVAQDSLCTSARKTSAPSAWPTRVGPGLRRLRDDLKPVLQRLAQPDSADAENVAAALNEIRERLGGYVDSDADTALATMQLSTRDDGQSARPIHATILVRLIGQAMQMAEPEISALMGAALTFDCTLTRLADIFNEQRAELTPEQRQAIKDHPECAVQALRAAGVEDPLWLDAVLHHHERLDGSGYPHGLAGDAISVGARLIALVDTYCAMIRPRAYRGAVAATEAMRAIFLERGRLVDESMSARLIREVGIYGPGGLVRLDSGEIGVVFRRGLQAGKPLVRMLVDRHGRTDVDRPIRDTSQPGLGIAESLSAERYQALLPGLEKLWD